MLLELCHGHRDRLGVEVLFLLVLQGSLTRSSFDLGPLGLHVQPFQIRRIDGVVVAQVHGMEQQRLRPTRPTELRNPLFKLRRCQPFVAIFGKQLLDKVRRSGEDLRTPFNKVCPKVISLLVQLLQSQLPRGVIVQVSEDLHWIRWEADLPAHAHKLKLVDPATVVLCLKEFSPSSEVGPLQFHQHFSQELCLSPSLCLLFRLQPISRAV
mmetsp:Transcript_59092/g.93574  ORF Transcript_59092/g.93574 Transcript_59092/m.93574 type:complete len:210 (-) Transcript_59092:118-747(-)